MKILIIGGQGTIGKKVVSYLNEKHEVLVAGRKSGDYLVDITKPTPFESFWHLFLRWIRLFV